MRLIPLEKAKEGLEVAKTIYGENGQVLLKEGMRLTSAYKERLAGLGVYSIYVRTKSAPDLVVEDVVSEKTRVQAVNLARQAVEKAKIGSTLNAKEVKEAVHRIIDDILANPNLVITLTDIRSVNDILLGHSVNTAVLATIVGVALGYDQLKLRNLAVGALFHDLGKIMIDKLVLNKITALSLEETEAIRRHPIYGYKILRNNPEIHLMSAHVALQHHECIDGSGFPRGLKGNEISEMARIVSVVDAYDRLTSDTLKRPRYSPVEVIEYLMAECNLKFDTDIVRLFLRSVAIYPVGAEVELNTGDSGVVIKVHRNFPTRPVVRIIKNKYGQVLNPYYELDLLEKTTVFIAKVIEEDGEVAFTPVQHKGGESFG